MTGKFLGIFMTEGKLKPIWDRPALCRLSLGNQDRVNIPAAYTAQQMQEVITSLLKSGNTSKSKS